MDRHGLDQVIEELKSRGVVAGEEEAQRIISKARLEAEGIVAKAKEEAEAIGAAARKERQDTLAAMEAELAQAARVGLKAFRRSIEQSFLQPELEDSLRDSLAKPSFLESAILEMVKGFAASGMNASDLEVLLPEQRREELGSFFMARLAARGARGVEVSFDPSISFGFRIGPKGGGFTFDLTEEGFRELLTRFMSPRFRKSFYAEADEGKAVKTSEAAPQAR